MLIKRVGVQAQWTEMFSGNITYNSIPAGYIQHRMDPKELEILYLGVNEKKRLSVASE